MLQKSNIPARAVAVVQKALQKAGLNASDLHSIEFVGSSMRVVAIKDAIQNALNKPLNSGMNAEEAVAIGCALLCARHSPASQTRAYDLIEDTGIQITASWRTLFDPNDTKITEKEAFPAAFPLPKAKARNLTLHRIDAKPFEVFLQYTPKEGVVYGGDLISHIQVPQIIKDNSMIRDVEVRVRVKADPVGTYLFEEVEMREEKEEVVIIEEKPEEKKSRR